MAEVIDITKYIKQKKERELDALSRKLAAMIEDLGITAEPEMYVPATDDQIYGLPSIYAVYPQNYAKQAENLSDVTDILTSLVIRLDGMGHTTWANQISNVVGEMFASGTFREG